MTGIMNEITGIMNEITEIMDEITGIMNGINSGNRSTHRYTTLEKMKYIKNAHEILRITGTKNESA